MSVNILVLGGLAKTAPVRLTTTSRTDVFTAEVGGSRARSTVLAVVCSNETAGAVNILIEYFDGTNNHFLFRRPVPANDTVFFSDFPKPLSDGMKIRATAASANAITVDVAVMLDNGMLGGGLFSGS